MSVISRGRNVDTLNPPPRNATERRWKNEHIRELSQALKDMKCPCGADLDEESNKLCDLGYKYGIECWQCR